MPADLAIPMVAAPYLLLASADVTVLVIWQFIPKSPLYQAGTRFALTSLAWSLVNGLWLIQSRTGSAWLWYRWIPALSLLAGLGAVESLAQMWGARLPRYYRLLYGVALGLLGLSAGWHPAMVSIGRIAEPGTVTAVIAVTVPRVAIMTAIAALTLTRRLDHRRQFIYGGMLVLLILCTGDSFLGPWYQWVTFPADWLPPAVLTLFLAVGLSRRVVYPERRQRGGAVLSAAEGYRYGAQVLAAAAAGVFCVGLPGLDDDTGLDAATVCDALAGELVAMCRSGDRVVRLADCEFLLVIPALAFRDEIFVRDRVERSLRAVVVSVGGRQVPIDPYVQVGWAWGDRAVSFSQVVQQARHSLVEETRRRTRVVRNDSPQR